MKNNTSFRSEKLRCTFKQERDRTSNSTEFEILLTELPIGSSVDRTSNFCISLVLMDYSVNRISNLVDRISNLVDRTSSNIEN